VTATNSIEQKSCRITDTRLSGESALRGFDERTASGARRHKPPTTLKPKAARRSGRQKFATGSAPDSSVSKRLLYGLPGKSRFYARHDLSERHREQTCFAFKIRG